MQNIYSLTEFIRLLTARPLGFSALYLVTEGKTYRATCKALAATAGREGLKISTSQAIVIDPATLQALEAVKLTVK